MRRLIALFVLALASLGLAAGSASASSNQTDWGLPPFKYNPFYVPPSPLPAGKPGDVIRWEKLDFKRSLTRQVPGAQGWLMMYLSTTATGAPVAVTGTVIYVPHKVPAQGVENRPIVAYGNEAQGLGDNCAVSRLIVHGQSGEPDMWKSLIRAGYAIVSSDLEGLGTPDVHPFGVTRPAAQNVLDSLRAARNLEAAQLPKNGPLAMFGYSQGGASVGMAAEIAPQYAPELNITAAAYGGAPINPLHVSKFVEGGLFASINFGASVGYDAAYPELDLESFLNDRGKTVLKKVYGACIDMIFQVSGQRSKRFLNPGMNPLEDPRWLKRFDENTLGFDPARAPKIPIYYWHAAFDEASPVKDARTMRRQYCANGTPLRYVELVGLDHVYGGPWWVDQAAKWLAARLEGKRPDPGNCRAGYSLGGVAIS
jgi:hypothetical protein